MALATFHLKWLIKDGIHDGCAYSETMAKQSVVGFALTLGTGHARLSRCASSGTVIQVHAPNIRNPFEPYCCDYVKPTTSRPSHLHFLNLSLGYVSHRYLIHSVQHISFLLFPSYFPHSIRNVQDFQQDRECRRSFDAAPAHHLHFTST